MNMAEIAKLAGTSVATVSRAFKSPDVVSPAIRKRIMKIAENHGYVYHAAAADLARQHSNFIGVLVPTANKSVFAETLMAIQERAQEHQLFPIIALHPGGTQGIHIHRRAKKGKVFPEIPHPLMVQVELRSTG